jgi:peptidyl-dipeptidase A
MITTHPFEEFLQSFIPKISAKSKQLNQAIWLLETTGLPDAMDLKATLDVELRLLFQETPTYQKLLQWDKDPALTSPLLKRQLHVLIRTFKENQLPPVLLGEIAHREAELSHSYANFRPLLDGKAVSENELRDILKKEERPHYRKQAWEASKAVGEVLAPQILALVALRNQAAHQLGYPNYFEMQLEQQEVESSWLFATLEELALKSDGAYNKVLDQIEKQQQQRFGVSREELGPWAWSDPFCQEDPLDSQEIDKRVADVDIPEIVTLFFRNMGLDILPILKRSDLFERPGKSAHAFCLNIDRKSDIRTLNNVKQTLRWLSILLHECGHAIYEMGYDPQLPWLLREPPHMATTEAMALLAGRQASLPTVLCELLGHKSKELINREKESLQRQQLIFSRWVVVMTYFERELYRNPQQDLNKLWWETVQRYQKIRSPQPRKGKQDWAAKYHLGLAPVYYYSYLMGEMLASAIEQALIKETGSATLASEKAGRYLQQKLFSPGNCMKWSTLIQQMLQEPLTAAAWLEQFATPRLS